MYGVSRAHVALRRVMNSALTFHDSNCLTCCTYKHLKFASCRCEQIESEAAVAQPKQRPSAAKSMPKKGIKVEIQEAG